MANQHPRLNFTTVELSHNIQVQTSLPPSCHAALRAGFEGYTANPRWTPQKRRAWKQGKQWRSELAANLIEVRDGLLRTPEAIARAAAEATPATEGTANAEETSSKGSFLQNLLGLSPKNPAMN